MPRLRALYHALVHALVVGALLVGTACSDRTGPTAPNDHAGPPDLDRQSAPAPGDPYAVARTIPGFGGFFVDAQGQPTVYLRDAGRRPQVEQALAPLLRAHGLAGAQLRVLQGRFDWAELEAWRDLVSPEALAVPGAVFVGADASGNRVRIGVTDPTGAAAVRETLAALRIPEGAVVVEQTAPMRNISTLQDRIRPVPGGVQIDFVLGICSLGFNAVKSGQNSFITASHCTLAQGGVEETPYFQNTFLDFENDDAIGTEVDDPLYFSSGRVKGKGSGCPRRRVCRYSDAARAAYDPGVEFTLGAIAKPAGVGSIDVSGGSTFSIQSKWAFNAFAGGTQVSKVGRTTGWTRATVTMSCANVNVDGTSITQLCATIASAATPVVGAGDSGSPVFIEGGADQVTLAGILWGGSTDGTMLAFSPMTGIEQELGTLTVR